MPVRILRPPKNKVRSPLEVNKFKFDKLLRHYRVRVFPLQTEKISLLLAEMEHLPSMDRIGFKDFDLSFIADYEKDILSKQNRVNFSKAERSSTKHQTSLGILEIFNEFTPTRSLMKIVKFVDLLMEKYGWILLNSVVDNTLGQTPPFTPRSGNQEKLHQAENKIVVFIDDAPCLPKKISWMGRMLTVGLLSCGIIPVVIPWNDLDDPNMQGILRELSPLSPSQKNEGKVNNDFSWILKKGFSLALKTFHKNIIIVDVDWNRIRIQEFIAEAETFGYELIFMKKHAEINRINFVQMVIDKILSRQRAVPAFDKHKQELIVEVVKHQDYTSQKQSKTPQQFSAKRNATVPEEEQLERRNFAFGDSLNEIEEDKLENVSEKVDSANPGVRNVKKATGFINRFFRTSISDSKIPNSIPRRRNKKFVFTLPKLFSSSEKNEDENLASSSEAEQVFNPHIIPRLTDENFDRILVQPKLYARKSQRDENKLFSHCRRDLDDLDSVFSKSTDQG